MLSFSAPSPTVEALVQNTPAYIGNDVILSCTITVDATVNSGVVLTSAWFGPSNQLTNSSHTLAVDGMVAQIYNTNVTIVRADSSDSGNYTCNATLVSVSSYIIGNSGAGTVTLSVEGL